MTIRRKPTSGGAGRKPRAPAQSTLDASMAMAQGREAVQRVLASAATEVNLEIERARAAFNQAEDLLTADALKVQENMAACDTASESIFEKTASAARQSQSAAQGAINAMLQQLNRINESIAGAGRQDRSGQGSAK